MGEYSKALTFYQQALKMEKKSLPNNHPSLATSCNNIGTTYNSMGEYSKALTFYQQALEIQKKSLPGHHPDVATSNNNIGLAYNSMGEYSKALTFYQQALEILKKSSSWPSSSRGHFLQQHRLHIQQHGRIRVSPDFLSTSTRNTEEKPFRTIILTWPLPTTTSAPHTTAWENTRKH